MPTGACSVLSFKHHFLDFGNRPRRVETLRAGIRAVHDRMTTIQPERILEIVEALGGRYRLSDAGRPLAITVEPPPAPDEDENDEPSEAPAAEARS